ncbi:MAG: carbohydrate ABC transporter permease [Treponema sp.]|nr:carbohydrate ABC transporter permease [Treponema sp.]
MSRAKKKRQSVACIFMVLLILISIVMLFPLFWLVRSSFMTQRELMTVPIKWFPAHFSFINFREVFRLSPFHIYLFNSALLASINVVGQILSASFIAFGFARLRFRFRGFWFAMLISTMMLPYTVVMIPQFIFWTNLLNAYNTFFPLTLPAFFGHPFHVFLVRQFYMGIPDYYDEAARVDGASYLVIYSKIIVPMSKPALTSVGVFTFVGIWNEFLGPLLYLDRDNLRTVSLGLTRLVGEYGDMVQVQLAGATLSVIPMIALFFFAQRYFIEGITFSGLKG